MKHERISEIVAGMLIKGQIEPDAVNPADLGTPYDQLAKGLQKGKPVLELKAEIGFSTWKGAEQAVKRIPLEPSEALELLHWSATKAQVASNVRRVADQLDRGGAIDLDRAIGEFEKLRGFSANGRATEPLTGSELLAKLGKRQDWIWRPWIPRGGYCVIGGDEGVGKTMLALTFARVVMENLQLPNCSYPGATGQVVWVETEGKLWENLDRLKEWGVNLDNLIVPDEYSLDLLSGKGWALLEREAERNGVHLLIIDSLGGAVLDENSPSCKSVSQRLSHMAQQHGIAIMATHHLSKPEKKVRHKPRTEIATHDFRGHGGLTQFATSTIGVMHPDPSREERDVMQVKQNLERKPPGFGYRITGEGIVEWTDRPQAPKQLPPKKEQAERLLKEHLANGSKLVSDLKAIAKKMGISESTLTNAKRSLGVRGFGNVSEGYFWELP